MTADLRLTLEETPSGLVEAFAAVSSGLEPTVALCAHHGTRVAGGQPDTERPRS